MLPYRDSRIVTVILVIFFVVVVVYGYWEARGIVIGPVISIPTEVTEVHESPITLEGNATRITSLAINGHTVPVTENGSFSEEFLPQVGYNRVTFEARDKYGTTRTRIMEILYTPTDPQASVSVSVIVGSTTKAK
jgi:hypothetical protein